MTMSQNEEISKYLHTLSDFERISDHALNLAESAKELHEKRPSFPAYSVITWTSTALPSRAERIDLSALSSMYTVLSAGGWVSEDRSRFSPVRMRRSVVRPVKSPGLSVEFISLRQFSERIQVLETKAKAPLRQLLHNLQYGRRVGVGIADESYGCSPT